MIYQTAYLSLLIQIVVGIIDFIALQIKIPENKKLFKDLLKIELGVQIIEMIFYIWLVFNFSTIPNITPKRYYDWILTTPIMLITLMAFLDSGEYKGISDYIHTHKHDIIKVLSANMMMLIFGLIGELGYIQYHLAILLGFIPFLYYYNEIYNMYIKKKEQPALKKGLFWFFFVTWSLYGVAAFFPYILKNSFYNILDLFAKNTTGLFLAYIILKLKV